MNKLDDYCCISAVSTTSDASSSFMLSDYDEYDKKTAYSMNISGTPASDVSIRKASRTHLSINQGWSNQLSVSNKQMLQPMKNRQTQLLVSKISNHLKEGFAIKNDSSGCLNCGINFIY